MDQDQDEIGQAPENETYTSAAESAPAVVDAVPETGIGQIIERWWADHFEGNPAEHPVPYLSGAWHYALAAKDDLKARLKATAG